MIYGVIFSVIVDTVYSCKLNVHGACTCCKKILWRNNNHTCTRIFRTLHEECFAHFYKRCFAHFYKEFKCVMYVQNGIDSWNCICVFE